MKIKTNFTSNIIPTAHAKGAPAENLYKDQPVNSFPFSIEELPKNTKYLAFTLIDHDAIPVCGFSWIHWLVANVPSKANILSIPENFSKNSSEKIQGTNSFASIFVGQDDTQITQAYVGPTPPDKDHEYTLTAYALSESLNLEQGFYMNQLYKALDHKLIEKTSIQLIGKK
ncbi:MAG: YbhB/YbcL family Raf kinase inhibitor-like protein [Streptococcaceae bacterium]|nr:YbhB/YbcL family Raf kinase inhibitor-like protein [Streptococcaceae bacterium]